MLCDDNPEALGCPCDDEGRELECYTGPAETLGVGECRAGVRRCEGGLWTTCLDEVRPAFEVCNLADDDCDGFEDDGTAFDGCGECAIGASCQCYGPREPCTAWGVETEGLAEGKAAALVLDRATEGEWRALRACAGASAQWFSVTIDAYLPGGSSLDLSGRSGDAAGLGEWTGLGTSLEDGQSFDLHPLAEHSGLVLELRVVLHAGPSGDSPSLREVRLSFFCADGGGP